MLIPFMLEYDLIIKAIIKSKESSIRFMNFNTLIKDNNRNVIFRHFERLCINLTLINRNTSNNIEDRKNKSH